MTRYQIERLIGKYNRLLYDFEYDASRLRKAGKENSAQSLYAINNELREVCRNLENN